MLSEQDLKEFSSGERLYFPYEKIKEDPLGATKEHLDRYQFALGFLKGGEVVLDAACGSGYGSQILAKKAKKVFGVDASDHAVAFAQKTYTENNLSFEVADLNKPLNVPDNSCDVIVSFETLEHVYSQENMLSEFRRVLKPNGLLLISTPDKDLISGGLKSDNPFHIKEVNKKEFLYLLNKFFKVENVYGQTGLIVFPLWKRILRSFRYIAPLRKFKQFAIRKLGLAQMVHRHFAPEKYIPIEKAEMPGPNNFYVLIAVCRKS